ncbi:hypothetical protein [Candidatus Sororendozoicomonas aggregata]|uniref:hypothetical protein n=1 Tax=Candidatus Sororendozoicomonas aggregata TaxID=3073239 RepID=UPI002ED55647
MMGIKSMSRARKFIATRPVVFITGVLTLFIMANAYSEDSKLYMNDLIPPGSPHYSEKGYSVRASGDGYCMYGVYNPASCTNTYSQAESCYVAIHYAASRKHWCVFHHSSQDFNIINNDTGEVVVRVQWYKVGFIPFIAKAWDPGGITALPAGNQLFLHPGKLNIYCREIVAKSKKLFFHG